MVKMLNTVIAFEIIRQYPFLQIQIYIYEIQISYWDTVIHIWDTYQLQRYRDTNMRYRSVIEIQWYRYGIQISYWDTEIQKYRYGIHISYWDTEIQWYRYVIQISYWDTEIQWYIYEIQMRYRPLGPVWVHTEALDRVLGRFCPLGTRLCMHRYDEIWDSVSLSIRCSSRVWRYQDSASLPVRWGPDMTWAMRFSPSIRCSSGARRYPDSASLPVRWGPNMIRLFPWVLVWW